MRKTLVLLSVSIMMWMYESVRYARFCPLAWGVLALLIYHGEQGYKSELAYLVLSLHTLQV